jgi:RNA polymerase sigma factor (sigma-70 family)
MDTKPTDRSLMRRFQNGDSRAAAALHDRYSARMRGLAKVRLDPALATRVDVEDIVQSALASFFRAVSKGVYQVPPSGELWQLLAAITRHKLNHARMRHLAAKRDVRRTVAAMEALDQSACVADQLAIELRLTIDEVVADYTEIERRIVELRIEGYEVEQIAERAARSRRTVERVLHGFREDLKRAL